MKIETLEALAAATAAKQAVVVATNLQSGESWLVDHNVGHNAGYNADTTEIEQEAAQWALRTDRCRLTEEHLFYRPYNPPLRLFIVGGVHIAQPLVAMAQATGYDVTVLDPRSAFANAERFAGVNIRNDWPDEALAELGIDARTAIVALTHDPKIDDPALMASVASPAFYIGALGSRRTHASRLQRLREQGIEEACIARIHGPIGLRLGGRAPAEIAIAIMAEMTAVLRAEPQ